MKRVLLIALAVVSMFLAVNCSKTAEPTGASNLFVSAGFSLSGGIGTGTCTLLNQTTSAYVNDATVTIAGESIPYSGTPGVYMKLAMAGSFATGSSITINITSSLGNVSATGIVPASGTNIVFVSGAYAGSMFTISQ